MLRVASRSSACGVLTNHPHHKHEWKLSWIFHKVYMYICQLPTCSSSLLHDLPSTCVVSTVNMTSVRRPGCSLVQLLPGGLHLIFSHYTIYVRQTAYGEWVSIRHPNTLFNLDSLQVMTIYYTWLIVTMSVWSWFNSPSSHLSVTHYRLWKTSNTEIIIPIIVIKNN